MKNLMFAALTLGATALALGTSMTPSTASLPTLLTGAVVSAATLAQTPGQFVTVDQDHATTGTAALVTANGQQYLEFDAAFDTARGPAVEVILYKGAAVPVNIAEGDYVTLAPLQSFSGAQRYLIPAGVNLDDYQTVGIWCRQFNVTFGYAPI
ncbi:DM13 domain-containing protein [Nodosilinea sp. LEGE 06152]|uniref:DM13 domain-containing protein n=1 Tax=Nodosilinea sp. LEGE 06152 TaxID=2777966 RepID=UPI00188177D9|nr:DM13 domain-containing protein [Nodosilinea sp. LEGE 06152]MBE9158150.1 DM13 domain-containing protein [Nodosilinea sp. LEGE 06152]